MRNFIPFLFLTFTICLVTNAQNVVIPDSIFKSKLLENELINLNADDEIQVSEAEAFNEELDLRSLGIQDLKGIEAFANLSELNVNYNDLIMLDVSNNTNLVALSCFANDIESLIIGNNSNFKFLTAYRNDLISIDLSQLPELETINIGTNDFVALDLSNNPNLSWIDLRDCKLQSLDVRNGNNTIVTKFYLPDNDELTCIAVDDPDFSTANWTDIDPWVQFSTDCFPYQLNFTVTDGTDPIEGAEITLINIFETTETTNAAGEAIVDDIGVSELLYKVEANGYKSTTGTVSVSNSDVNIDVVLEAGEPDVVNIPDEIFLNYLLSNTTINSNGDEFIQESEAAYYNDNLDVGNLRITDLTGIGSFVNITSLNCRDNRIINLDVSQNINLIDLSCHNNYTIETLTIGSNTNLEYLSCYSNKLTELDVTGFPKLRHISCGDNDFTTLDVSQNTMLSSFDCRNSKLTHLDVRNGNNETITNFYMPNTPDLTCINVDDVPFAMANWTDVDDHINFSTDCSVSYQVTFNISDGTNPIEDAHLKMNGAYFDSNSEGQVVLEDLGTGIYNYSVVADNFESILSTVNVAGNIVENVVLSSGTPAIVYIPDYKLRSYLLAIDTINTNMDDEIQVTEANSQIGRLDVSSLDIIDMTGIAAFSGITELKCNNNDIINLDVSQNTNLNALSCYNNYTIETLTIGSNPNLEYLSCYSNKLTELDVTGFPKLNHISCGSNDFTTLDVSQNNMLTSFDCRDSKLIQLDVRNDNNEAITNFYMPDTPDLTCISVDNVPFAMANWTDVDEHVNFSTDCLSSNLVTFNISDGTNPIQNAHLKMNDAYFDTNSEGQVVLEDVGAGIYDYSVVANNYESVISTLTVSGNTIKDVVLNSGTPAIVYIPDYKLRSYLLAIDTINTNMDGEIQVTEANTQIGTLAASGLDIVDMTGISAFIGLTGLECNNNDIINLDVSQNTNLIDLSCYNNYSIETLIIGSNPNLEYLSCYSNKLTVLDVTGFPMLKTLRCGNNDIRAMDLSQNVNLSTFDCRSSRLAQLDARNGNNEAISFFYIPDNPYLNCVSVDDIGFATTNWTDIDEGLTFSLSCNGSNDASLSSIMVNDEAIEDFITSTFAYDFEINTSTNDLPIVTATTTDTNASIEITQTESIKGTATIDVKAENGLASSQYTIQFIDATGNDQYILKNYKIYPNPVADYINLNFTEEIERILLYNATGKMIKQFSPNLIQLNVSNLESGIYYLKITSNNKSVSLKFVK